MPRNIVVYSDGTGQDGGVRAEQRLSNVYKMYRASRVGPDSSIDPSLQVAFYDAGLGTDDDVKGFGRLARTIGKFLGSVAGRGIGTNIADCYEFVLNHWRPGDRIYIVGFSRGAYTARCVAQVLSLCGVPLHEAGRPDVPFRRFARSTRQAAERAVHQVYEHGAGRPIAEFEGERAEQARRFREDHGSGDADGTSNAYPYFVGVFDTVAALGAKGWRYVGLVAMFAVLAAVATALGALALSALPRVGFLPAFAVLAAVAGLFAWWRARRGARRFIDDYPEKGSPRRVHHIRWQADNYDRGLSGHVGYARQASAIDEDRADFPRVGWGRGTVVRQRVGDEPPPFVQLWFAGNHSDIGGSYPEAESRLSDVALGWMVQEAESLPHALVFDHALLHVWPDHTGVQHSEVFATRDRRLWWVPPWMPAWLREGWRVGLRRASGSPMHPTVFARFAHDAVDLPEGPGRYRPSCLADDARFAWHYGLEPAGYGDALREIGLATFRVEGDRPADFRVGDAADSVRAALAGMGVACGVVVPTGAWQVADRDHYRDSLSHTHLAGELARSSLGVRASGIVSPVDPLFVRGGWFVDDADEARGRALAAQAGQPFFLVVAPAGVAVTQTWPRP